MYNLSCGFPRRSHNTDGGEEFVDETQNVGKPNRPFRGESIEKISKKALWKSVRRLKQVRSILSPKGYYARTETRALKNVNSNLTKNRLSFLSSSRKGSQEEVLCGKTRCSKATLKKVSSETPLNKFVLQGRTETPPPATATTVWSLSNVKDTDHDDDSDDINYDESARQEPSTTYRSPEPEPMPLMAQPTAVTPVNRDHVSMTSELRQGNTLKSRQSSLLEESGSLSNVRKRPLSPVLKRPDSPAGFTTSTNNRSTSMDFFKTPQPIKMEEFPPVPEKDVNNVEKSAPTTAPGTPSPTNVSTSLGPVPETGMTKINGAEILATKLKALRASYSEMIKEVDHHDCKVPNAILETMQKEILDVFHDYYLTPRFLIKSRLTTEQRREKASPSSSITSGPDVSKLANRSARIDNVLAEPYMKFFIQPSENTPTKRPENLTSVQKIDGFINEIHNGPYSGRVPIGSALKGVQDFPVVMYGCGDFDPALQSHIPQRLQGEERWRKFCDSFCPIVVSVLLEPATTGKKSQDKRLEDEDVRSNLEQIGELLANLLSDWRTHRLRIFTVSAGKHQLLVPSIESISQTDMKKAGWSEMKFGGENVVRWKCISAGVLLSYISGAVETSLDKALTLVYDGDSHKNWIPFLTETERIYGLAPFLFSFGYGIALPWPLNRRELVVLGMATDALRQPGISSIQMWGTHIPDAATTAFGIPVKKPPADCVCLELPVLSFFLSPIEGNKTQVRMLAAVDVKMNIVPSALQTYMAKHMATKMFKNVQKLCKDFDKTEYSTILKENQEAFDTLLSGVDIAIADIKKTKAAETAEQSNRKRLK